MQKITIIVNSCLRNILLLDNLYKQKGARNRLNTISWAENVTRIRRTFDSFLYTQTTINTRLQKITILDHYRLRNNLLRNNLYKKKGQRNMFDSITKIENVTTYYTTF